jgi:hypothetical protein
MITNALFTLSNTVRQQVVSPSTMPQEVHLHNANKSSNQYIYVGNESVTLSNSIHLDPGESKVLQLMPNDSLHALSDPNGLLLGVLTIRQG